MQLVKSRASYAQQTRHGPRLQTFKREQATRSCAANPLSPQRRQPQFQRHEAAKLKALAKPQNDNLPVAQGSLSFLASRQTLGRGKYHFSMCWTATWVQAPVGRQAYLWEASNFTASTGQSLRTSQVQASSASASPCLWPRMPSTWASSRAACHQPACRRLVTGWGRLEHFEAYENSQNSNSYGRSNFESSILCGFPNIKIRTFVKAMI